MRTPNMLDTTPLTWARSLGDDASFRRDIVVIGAGSGGLTAVCRLLKYLPSTLDATILLSLDVGFQPSLNVLQILRGYATLPVAYATHCAPVRSGRVVLAPARQNMIIVRPGTISLEHERAFSAGTPSVNRLFETAAVAYGKRVIAVVMSGASHDGTAGLTLVEAAGGVGVVQEPQEAANESMPQYAMRVDHPDYCCSVERMAPLLVKLIAGETPSGGLKMNHSSLKGAGHPR